MSLGISIEFELKSCDEIVSQRRRRRMTKKVPREKIKIIFLLLTFCRLADGAPLPATSVADELDLVFLLLLHLGSVAPVRPLVCLSFTRGCLEVVATALLLLLLL